MVLVPRARGSTVGAAFAGLVIVMATGSPSWSSPADVNPQVAKNPNSQRCLGVYHSGTANGTNVDIWDCNQSVAQQWGQRA